MKTFAFAALAAASIVVAEEFRVAVGQGGVTFEPNQVTAKVGDIVHFEFRGGNHTVTQSSFAEPCTQQFNTLTQFPGVDSGFVPAPAEGATEIPVWTVEVVQDTTPIWMFCARAPHCNNGMVFAINAPPTGERTFDAFLAKAATATHPAYGTLTDFTPPNAPPTVGDGIQITDPLLDPSTPSVNDPVGPPPVVSVLPPSVTTIGVSPEQANAQGSGAMSVRNVSAGVVASFITLLATATLF